MSLSVSPVRQGIYPVVHEFAAEIATEANAQAEGNCIEHALMTQDLFNNRIGEVRELQSAEVDCGVVITVESMDYTLSSKRLLHASNYILARLEDRQALVELDGYESDAHRVRAATDPIRMTTRPSFRHNSAIYGERRDNRHGWKSGVTDNIRETPFRLNPHHEHKIILGPQAGRVALLELQKANRYEEVDRSRIPVLLLKARP